MVDGGAFTYVTFPLSLDGQMASQPAIKNPPSRMTTRPGDDVKPLRCLGLLRFAEGLEILGSLLRHDRAFALYHNPHFFNNLRIG